MPLFDEPEYLHDFPDRAIRRLLHDPSNLRELIAALLPDLVARFDFSQLRPAERDFLLDDWRGRESDLRFRLPFRLLPEAPALPPALVCLLIEHQSEPDRLMPLRVLLYAVLFWEREWREWEREHPHGEGLRLSPVVPIILHTGDRPWGSARLLSELIGGPAEFSAYAPVWQPLFWDLGERTVEELLQATGEWLAALAVVQAEGAAEATFQAALTQVLRRLERISETETVRWHELLWFVLSWGMRRRPGEEREALVAAARESQADVQHREEVRKMSEAIERTWEQELVSRGEARGEVSTRQEDLRLLLEERFGPLPAALVAQIEAIQDPGRLRTALRQAVHLTSLAEFQP